MVVMPETIRIRETDDHACAACLEDAVAVIKVGGATEVHLCRRHLQDLAWEAVSFVQNEMGIQMAVRR